MRILFSIVVSIYVSFFCIATAFGDAVAGDPTSTKFSQAVQLYNQKRYDLALPIFDDLVRADSKNATAFYYEASCRALLGKKDQAIKVYQYIVSTFPGTREAQAASLYLSKVVGPNPLSEPITKASQKSSKSDGGSAKSQSPQESKKQIIEKMLVIIRPLADRPTVPESMIANVKEALDQYPNNLLSMLYRQGCQIHLTPTTIDEDPSVEHATPSGYEYGSSYKNVPAFFDGHNVVVCAFAIRGVNGSEWQSTDNPVGALRHELGHALDAYLGYISQREDFKHAYYLDCGQIDDDTKAKLAYFLQKAETGPSEAFAEICCCKFGGRGERGDSGAIESAFKGARKVIDRSLAEAK